MYKLAMQKHFSRTGAASVLGQPKGMNCLVLTPGEKGQALRYHPLPEDPEEKRYKKAPLKHAWWNKMALGQGSTDPWGVH